MQVKSEELKKFLLAYIRISKDKIKRKKEAIKYLQDEVTVEQQHIDEAVKLIEELNLQINDANKLKGENSDE